MENPETALDIEYGINNKKDNNIDYNYNKEQLYKLNFNFDILNIYFFISLLFIRLEK